MPHKQFADAPNYWHVPLCETCITHPWEFFKSCVCPCCYSFCQRIDIYEGDLETKYQCCGGAYGCDDCFCGRSCPHLCLCLEVCLCFWCSIYGNRFLIQSMYQVRNTMFETFIMWMMCICSFVICILSFFIQGLRDEWFQCLCDLIYLAFSACMQTQQHCELSHQRKGPKGTEMNNI